MSLSLLSMSGLLLPLEAQALPSFARQTGQPSVFIHARWYRPRQQDCAQWQQPLLAVGADARVGPAQPDGGNVGHDGPRF